MTKRFTTSRMRSRRRRPILIKSKPFSPVYPCRTAALLGREEYWQDPKNKIFCRHGYDTGAKSVSLRKTYVGELGWRVINLMPFISSAFHGEKTRLFVKINGQVPEWSMGADCKSAGRPAYEGSNPSLSTIQCALFSWNVFRRMGITFSASSLHLD